MAYMNLNSGDLNEDRIKRVMMRQNMITRDIPSTTSPADLEKKYAECRFLGIPLIIGSTYHSFPKLLQTNIPISLKIADEAHNLVGNIGRFSQKVKKDFHKVKSAQFFSFTATRATSPHYEDNPDVGSGMQNTNLFGKILFIKTPKEMVDAGEIVPPYCDQIEITAAMIKNNNIQDCTDIENVEVDALVIMEGFKQLKTLHYKYSSAPEKMGTKLLVTFKGQPSFDYFFNSDVVKTWAKKNKVTLVGMSSASGAYINGKTFPSTEGLKYRDEFALYLKQTDNCCQMIIGHIDMIGEGINIPTLLGVLPLRDLGTIKSAHTLGRAMRLFPEDRINFYSGEIKNGERNKMVKPYCWVIAPLYSFALRDGSDRIMKMARQIREDLGYNPLELSSEGGGEGRVEQFYKDPRMPDDEVNSLDLLHMIDDPEFEERKLNEINICRAYPQEARKFIKTLIRKN